MKRLEWSLLSDDNSLRVLFAIAPLTAHNLLLRSFLKTPQLSLQQTERGEGAGFAAPPGDSSIPHIYLLAESLSLSQGRN